VTTNPIRRRWLLYDGAFLMIVTPIVFYPASKCLWLVVDLVFRRPERDDFAS